jgi:hypothetical protein
VKTVLWSAVLVAASGCFPQYFYIPESKAPAKHDPAAVKRAGPRPPAVTPEQVNASNARQVAEALEEECDADGGLQLPPREAPRK